MEKKPLRYDLYNENFDFWFKGWVESMTPNQKSLIPDDLLFKLFTNKGGTRGDLSFKEKVHILASGFGKEVIIVVKDEDNGIDAKDFNNAQKAKKSKMMNSDLINNDRTNASFILASKSLFESMAYLSHVYTSDIWTFINKINTTDVSVKAKNFAKGKDAIKSLVRLLLNYELNKKRIVMEQNMTTSMLYAILFFSTGEKKGVDFYNGNFKYAYNCNRSEMHRGLLELYKKGYLDRRGSVMKQTYFLTSKGVDLLDSICKKIIQLYKI